MTTTTDEPGDLAGRLLYSLAQAKIARLEKELDLTKRALESCGEARRRWEELAVKRGKEIVQLRTQLEALSRSRVPAKDANGG